MKENVTDCKSNQTKMQTFRNINKRNIGWQPQHVTARGSTGHSPSGYRQQRVTGDSSRHACACGNIQSRYFPIITIPPYGTEWNTPGESHGIRVNKRAVSGGVYGGNEWSSSSSSSSSSVVPLFIIIWFKLHRTPRYVKEYHVLSRACAVFPLSCWIFNTNKILISTWRSSSWREIICHFSLSVYYLPFLCYYIICEIYYKFLYENSLNPTSFVPQCINFRDITGEYDTHNFNHVIHISS